MVSGVPTLVVVVVGRRKRWSKEEQGAHTRGAYKARS